MFKEQKIIIRNIKMRRVSLGVNQKELARKSRLGHSTIGQLEIGLKVPSVETLAKIAKALKLKTYELLMPDLYTL